MAEHRIAFIGAGGIANAHAYALSALPFYYEDAPKFVLAAVSSVRSESRENFVDRFGFAEALSTDELWVRDDIDTVYLLGPNEVHFSHLKSALDMSGVLRVYVEKPLCVTEEEESDIRKLDESLPASKTVQAGYQYLQMSAIRRALKLWATGELGEPIHFHLRYLHSGYLDREYRDKRRTRLKPTPEGGALPDLGSHALSLLSAFLGQGLEVLEARQSGFYEDVPPDSDLCCTVLLEEKNSGAVGSMVASRVSAGTGDLLELEIRAKAGAIKFSTDQPDILEVYHHDRGEWTSHFCGSDYMPLTKFPSDYLPAGWLRSMVHAHYLFHGGRDDEAVIPDLAHALDTQRLIRTSAKKMAASRSN